MGVEDHGVGLAERLAFGVAFGAARLRLPGQGAPERDLRTAEPGGALRGVERPGFVVVRGVRRRAHAFGVHEQVRRVEGARENAAERRHVPLDGAQVRGPLAAELPELAEGRACAGSRHDTPVGVAARAADHVHIRGFEHQLAALPQFPAIFGREKRGEAREGPFAVESGAQGLEFVGHGAGREGPGEGDVPGTEPVAFQEPGHRSQRLGLLAGIHAGEGGFDRLATLAHEAVREDHGVGTPLLQGPQGAQHERVRLPLVPGQQVVRNAPVMGWGARRLGGAGGGILEVRAVEAPVEVGVLERVELAVSVPVLVELLVDPVVRRGVRIQREVDVAAADQVPVRGLGVGRASAAREEHRREPTPPHVQRDLFAVARALGVHVQHKEGIVAEVVVLEGRPDAPERQGGIETHGDRGVGPETVVSIELRSDFALVVRDRARGHVESPTRRRARIQTSRLVVGQGNLGKRQGLEVPDHLRAARALCGPEAETGRVVQELAAAGGRHREAKCGLQPNCRVVHHVTSARPRTRVMVSRPRPSKALPGKNTPASTPACRARAPARPSRPRAAASTSWP